MRILILVLPALIAQAQETREQRLDAAAKAHDQGRYAEAERLLRAVVAESEEPDPRDLVLLGDALRAQGPGAGASPVYRRALEALEKTLGDAHPDLIPAITRLARSEARAAPIEAEALLKRALAIREKLAASAMDPALAEPVEQLGLFYQMTARYTQAQDALLRSLAIRERALGAEHGDLAAHYHRLAAVFASQKKDSEAEFFHQRAVQI
ncbi:MAG: tetratricopeptide repeat protein, partial [Bryobacteraceae bacterium]